jgi:hypothetical protein
MPPELMDFAFAYVYSGTGRTQCRSVFFTPNDTGGFFTVLYESFLSTVNSSTSPDSSSACDAFTNVASTINNVNLDDTSEIMIWTASRLLGGAGLIYQSRWDATQHYPTTPAPVRGMYWVISVPGIINGVSYQINDWLVYHGGGLWDKSDNTELPYMLYRGTWSALAGAAPPAQPPAYFWENKRQGHYWIISEAGTISGVDYDIGDWIVWTGTSWDQRFRDHVITSKRWRVARNISLIGGSASGDLLKDGVYPSGLLDGSADVTIPVTVHKWTVPRKMQILGSDAGGECTFDGSQDFGIELAVKKWNIPRTITFVGGEKTSVTGIMELDGSKNVDVILSALHTLTADKWAEPISVSITGSDVTGGIPLMDGSQSVDLALTVLHSQNADVAVTAHSWQLPTTINVEGYPGTDLNGSVTFRGPGPEGLNAEKTLKINVVNVPSATRCDISDLSLYAKVAVTSEMLGDWTIAEITKCFPSFIPSGDSYTDSGGDRLGSSIKLTIPNILNRGTDASDIWYFPANKAPAGTCHSNCFGAGRHCGKW